MLAAFVRKTTSPVLRWTSLLGIGCAADNEAVEAMRYPNGLPAAFAFLKR